jgi:hypothetical protein
VRRITQGDERADAARAHVAEGPTSPDLRAKEVVSMPEAFDIAAFDAGAFDVGSVTLETDPTVNVLAVVKEAAAFRRRLGMPQQLADDREAKPTTGAEAGIGVAEVV